MSSGIRRAHGRDRGDRQHAADRAQAGRRRPAESGLHQVRAPEPGRQRQGPHRARDHPRRRGARRARAALRSADDDHRGHRRQHRHGPRADRRRARLPLHLRASPRRSRSTSASRCASSAPRSTSRRPRASRAPTTSATSRRGSPRRTAGSSTNQFHNPANLDAHYGAQGFSAHRPGDLRADARGTDRRVRVAPPAPAARSPASGAFLKEKRPGRQDRDGRSGRLGPRRVGQHRHARPRRSVRGRGHRLGERAVEPPPRRRSTAPRRSPTPRRSRWSSASSRKRASPSAARPASTSSPRCASRRAATLRGPVVTIAADLWDRYRSTAWMKAWEEREAQGLVFLQPTPKP